ncbi:MAG: hypothetical protein RP166_3600 [Rapeseed phyllody phytoplasma]|uniref:Uncharacterized protein n=1 Tax=Rapeseed phyllody phytoplasma TaxID=2490543 RepID=A0A859I9S7_9MOLU|nr:MAG: hypothetical protein RP166_3600 [Rapeseed phyllody phytoplasma]
MHNNYYFQLLNQPFVAFVPPLLVLFIFSLLLLCYHFLLKASMFVPILNKGTTFEKVFRRYL